ncbi:calcium binding protein 39 [Pseudoscourfieldia marina]
MSFLWGKKAHHPKPAELVSLTLEAWARVRAQDNSTHSSAQESGGRASFSGSSDNAASSRPTSAKSDSSSRPTSGRLGSRRQDASPASSTKDLDELTERLAALRKAMTPTAGDAKEEETARTVATEASAPGVDLLAALVAMLPRVPFEGKKDAAAIFQGLMRTTDANGKCHALAHVVARGGMLASIAEKYDAPDEALHAGCMLKECVRHEELAQMALTDEEVMDRLFTHADDAHFDVASYAFGCLADLLTRFPAVVASTLGSKCDFFTKRLNVLIASENYVTRRQSLRLLARTLQTPANLKPFTAPYVSDVSNLVLCMEALRDSSKSIQGEAFHVVKIFIANPVKPPDISAVLTANQPKLLRLLKSMPAPPPPPPSSGAGVAVRADAPSEDADIDSDLAEVIDELESMSPPSAAS